MQKVNWFSLMTVRLSKNSTNSYLLPKLFFAGLACNLPVLDGFNQLNEGFHSALYKQCAVK